MSGWLGMLLMTGGLTALTIALVMLYKIFVFYRYSITADGKIVEIEYVENGGRHRGYAAIIEFTIESKTGKSRAVRFTGNELKNSSAYRIGSILAVRYVPQNPEFAKINSFAEIWLEPLAGIALGSAFMALGLALLGKL